MSGHAVVHFWKGVCICHCADCVRHLAADQIVCTCPGCPDFLCGIKAVAS